jgi:hypothetical protein
VIGGFCFSPCQSPSSISCYSDSKLSQIERDAFCESGLTSIHLPASVEVICERSFFGCTLLTSISFESRSPIS